MQMVIYIYIYTVLVRVENDVNSGRCIDNAYQVYLNMLHANHFMCKITTSQSLVNATCRVKYHAMQGYIMLCDNILFIQFLYVKAV